MDIEPLKSMLEWVDDKKETLLYYFPTDVKEKVINRWGEPKHTKD